MNDKEEKQIQALISALDKAYGRTSHLVYRGFIIGLASGLGATIGVALIVYLLGFVLHQLGALPVIGDWFDSINRQLPNN